MLLDANLLIYAVHRGSPQHDAARHWLETVLASGVRVAMPVQTIAAFLRLMTSPRVFAPPLTAVEARGLVADWLAVDRVWVPAPGPETVRILLDMLAQDPGVTGDLVPDAVLAALAVEHGLTVQSTDSDFHRLPCSWSNPLAEGN